MNLPLFQSLPIVRFPSVYHVGTLDRSRRGCQGSSLEGHLLSVSRCPMAWRQIARLGGGDLYEMKHRNCEAAFLDMHAVLDRPHLLEEIKQWGMEHGYATKRELWQVWSTDEEENWQYMLNDSLAGALLEADADSVDDVPGPDGQPGVRPVEMLVATERLIKHAMLANMHSRDATDYVIMAWAESHYPELSGVWWEEKYDPARLSAPRGGIFPHVQASFDAVKTDWSQAPNEYEEESSEEDDDATMEEHL